MKRILCLCLALITVTLFVACGEVTTQEPSQEPAHSSETPIESSQTPTQGPQTPTQGPQIPTQSAVITSSPTESQKPSPTKDVATTVPPTKTPTAPTKTPVVDEPNALAVARKDTQIGIWYSIWYTEGFWDSDGGPTKLPIYYRPLLQDGTYGKYLSSNKSIMNWHIQEISNAGIDFLILDQTNDIDVGNGALNQNALRLVGEIYKWNIAGNRPLKYCSAIGAYAELSNDMSIIESEAKKLWERYVDGKKFGTSDHHMYVDGKPLMVIFPFTEREWLDYKDSHPGLTPYADKFTIRFAEGHAYEAGYWGWAMPKGTLVNEDVACVIPGWYKFNHPLEKVYRNKGQTYKKNWETVLSSSIIPKHIVINSFNEYAEHTAVFTAQTTGFPSDYPLERWIDSTGKENPSMYWDMTKLYISKFRNGDTK